MTEKTSSYEGVKVSREKVNNTSDPLVVEEALQITINGEPYSVTMQTPGDEKTLCLGLLYAEGFFLAENLPQIEVHHEESDESISHINAVIEDLPSEEVINKRSLLSAASCGICGSRTLEFAGGEALVDNSTTLSDTILSLFDEMRTQQHAFEESGGSHAAAIFNHEHQLMSLKEDVGRHNAVDKTVGDLLLKGSLSQAHCLLVSGRISYEIVTKCFKAKIPILAAVSAPSSLAVDFAKELGITLLGFCRDDRFTVYSHPNRIKALNFKSK